MLAVAEEDARKDLETKVEIYPQGHRMVLPPARVVLNSLQRHSAQATWSHLRMVNCWDLRWQNLQLRASI